MPLPTTMRAARIHRYGPPEVLVIDRVPLPEVGPRDVLVEVHAAAVNVVDCKIRAGSQAAVVRLALPWTLGLDVSGVVVAAGREVERFRVGDPVYGSPPHTRPGSYADYVSVDAEVLAAKPSELSHVEAAAVPLVGLTAWESLEAGSVGPGDRVLILAGSGGVGSMAIQLARCRGAHVTTTTSADNEALVRELGADEVIDFESQDVWSMVKDLDFALCTLGRGDREHALRAVKRGGTVVSLVADIPTYAHRYGPTLGAVIAGVRIGAFLARGRVQGRRAVQLTRHADGATLDRLTPLLQSGVLRPVIDRVLPFEQIADAHRASETGRAVGKIVVQMR